MNRIFKAIDKTLEKFNGVYSQSKLESIIINSIISLVTDAINYESNNIDNRKIKQIRYFLKQQLSNVDLSNEDIIMYSYEYINENKSKREKYGIYYTPKWIVKYIVDSIMNELIKNKKDISKIKILEPACGCGNFLLYVFDKIFYWYKNNTTLADKIIVRQIIEENLYGVDIDSEALKIYEILLSIRAYKKTGLVDKFHLNLLNTDFLKKHRFDSLDFDVILGNPPYLENRRINKYFDKDYYKKEYLTAVGRFDLYSLFIEKSINLLKKQGKLGFIIPGNLLSNNNFSLVRKFILDKTCINEIVYLGEGIFRNVGMNMAIIILVKSNKGFDNIIKCLKGRENLDNGLKPRYRYIPQKNYTKTLKNVFDIESSDITFKIRERIFSNEYLKINDICEVVAGIATGNVRKKLITRNKNIPNAKKVLKGKDVFTYCYKWSGDYFIDNKDLIDKSKGEYATFMRKEFIHNEKILIRQTADRFICAYDNNGFYILNTLYSLILRQDYQNKISLKYVLGFLNSMFNNYLYKTLVRENGKIFPQLKIFHIQNSPIKICENNIKEKIETLVDKIIFHKIKLINSDIDQENIYRIQIKIELLQNKLDDIIFKVFNLSEEEIQDIKRELGQSPIEYEIQKHFNLNAVKEDIKKYGNIIKVCKKHKVNPLCLYDVN